jgi:hypothetical protein
MEDVFPKQPSLESSDGTQPWRCGPRWEAACLGRWGFTLARRLPPGLGVKRGEGRERAGEELELERLLGTVCAFDPLLAASWL